MKPSIPSPASSLPSPRERILLAAVTEFGRYGFAATSLKQIAATQGLKAPAVYNHFESKERLLAAATSWAVQQFHEAVVAPDDPGRPPVARLENLVRRHIHFQLEHLDLARCNDLLLDEVMMKSLLPSDDIRELRRQLRVHSDAVVDVVHRMSPRRGHREAMMAAFAITSMCDRVTAWYRPAGPSTVSDVADVYWSMALAIALRPDDGS